jgi:hypothetical protein
MGSPTAPRTRSGSPPATPSVPARVAPATGVGSGQVQLTWIAPPDGGGATITDYVIQRSTNDITWTTVDDGISTATASTVRGLIKGTHYRFRVAARNVVGQGLGRPRGRHVGSPEAGRFRLGRRSGLVSPGMAVCCSC